MKNIFIIIISVLLVGNLSFAQETIVSNTNERQHIYGEKSNAKASVKSTNTIYLSEDFEAGTFPTGWAEEIGSATTGWTVGDNQSTQYWTIPDHTKYMAANDDLCNCDMSDFMLYTPSIDLSAAVSPILKFDYYLANQYGCLTSVLLSIDGGTNYSLVTDLEGNAGWESITLNLSAAANQPSVKIAFHFNDQNEWTNGFVLDDVSVEDLSLIPNLEANIEGFVKEYFSVPVDQASFSPKGSVFNHTSALNQNVDYELRVTGVYTEAMPLSIPFEYYSRQNITFAPFAATQEATYTFEYFVNYSSDLDPLDNTISKDIYLGGNDLIRDNGIHKGNVGVTRDNGELGNVFTINSQDTLTSVKFKMLNDDNNNGDEVSVVIREFDEIPGAELAHSVTVINDGSAEYDAALTESCILQAGRYYIGVQEGEHNMRLEYTTTEYTDSTAWGFWKDVAGDDHPGESYWRYTGGGDYGFKHTYYIRPQFANITNTSVNSLTNNDIIIFPNPASTNIQITGLKLQAENLQIIDITGKVVITSSLQGTKQSIDISNLEKGIYYLKINTDTQKFIKI